MFVYYKKRRIKSNLTSTIMFNTSKKCWSILQNGKVVAYSDIFGLTDCCFYTLSSKRVYIAGKFTKTLPIRTFKTLAKITYDKEKKEWVLEKTKSPIFIASFLWVSSSECFASVD